VPQSLVSLYVHVIFSTKHREPTIDADLAPRLYGFVGGIIRQTGSALITIGGVEDHVHLLVSLGRQTPIADLVRDIKSNSSKWVHEMFPDRSAFARQAGYGAFAVSVSLVDRVKAYIAGQKEHHKEHSFQDEFRTFHRKHP
jgi:REP element-mobilizing transposase RayT